jgi:hypothetical protein
MLFLKRMQQNVYLLRFLYLHLQLDNGSSNFNCLMMRYNKEASFILVMEHLKSMVRYYRRSIIFSLSSGGFKFDD